MKKSYLRYACCLAAFTVLLLPAPAAVGKTDKPQAYVAYVMAYAKVKGPPVMIHPGDAALHANRDELLEFHVLGDGKLADKPFAKMPFSAAPLCVDPTGRFLLARTQDGLCTYRINPNGTLGHLAATYRADVFGAITFAPNRPDIFYSPYVRGDPPGLSTYRLLPSGRIVRQRWHFTLKDRDGRVSHVGVGDIVFLRNTSHEYVEVLTNDGPIYCTSIVPVRSAPSGELQPWTPPPSRSEYSAAQNEAAQPLPPDPRGLATYAASPAGHYVYQGSTHGLYQYRVMPGGSLRLRRESGMNLLNDGDSDAHRVDMLVLNSSVYLATGWLPYAVRDPIGKDGTLLAPQAVSIGLDGRTTEIPLKNEPSYPLPQSSFQDVQIIENWTIAPTGQYIYLATNHGLSLYRLLPDGRWRFLHGPVLQPLVLESPIFVGTR